MRAVTAAGFTSGPLPIESVESRNELPRASPSAIAGAGDSRSGPNLPYLAPYFLDFARRARAVTDVPLMLTGGFETREQAADAVASGAVDIVSLARAMVLNPRLAEIWFTEEGGDPEFPVFDTPPRGGVTAWYTMRLTALGENRENSFTLDPQSALRIYEERDAQRCIKWREKYSDQPGSG